MTTKFSEMMMGFVAMIMSGWMNLKQSAYSTLTAKKAGLEGFVVALLICVIAIVIAFIFRDAIIAWFQTIMAQFTNETQNLF